MNYAIRRRLAEELNEAHFFHQDAARDIFYSKETGNKELMAKCEATLKESKLMVDKAQIACSNYKAKSLASGIPLALDQPDFSELISYAEEYRDSAGEDEDSRGYFDILAEKVLTIVFGEDFFDWYNDQSE
jgi:hypothetical protein